MSQSNSTQTGGLYKTNKNSCKNLEYDTINLIFLS